LRWSYNGDIAIYDSFGDVSHIFSGKIRDDMGKWRLRTMDDKEGKVDWLIEIL